MTNLNQLMRRLKIVNAILKNSKIVEGGDVLVNTGSMPIERRHRTNMLKVTVIE